MNLVNSVPSRYRLKFFLNDQHSSENRTISFTATSRTAIFRSVGKYIECLIVCLFVCLFVSSVIIVKPVFDDMDEWALSDCDLPNGEM